MLLAVLSKCWWCISTSISTQKARGAALEGWFRKEVGYTLSFSLEWRTRFCARGGRHGALTFIERAAFSGELPILLCSNLSSICIQSPFRDNFISVSWLLSTIYFPGVAVCCNILPLKRISSFGFNRNLSFFKAFNAFLNKSRRKCEDFCSSEMSFGAAKEGGGWWGLAWKPTLHNESLSLGSKLNIRKGKAELLKPRSLCPGCKFAQESHFVASFMAIICILSPLMQFPFSPTGSPRETPNKISGQGPRSWERVLLDLS